MPDLPGSVPGPDPHRPRGTPRASRRFRWRVVAWVAVHLAVLAHLLHWQLAGTTLSPLEPSEAGETLTQGVVNAGFLLFAFLILATLILGRFFCGWACHVVAYQDASAWLLGRMGLRPRPVRSRLLALIPFVAAFDMFLLPSLLRAWHGVEVPTWELHLFTDGFLDRFPGPGIALLTFAVDGFLLVYFLGSKGFCTYGCPYGALFGVADRVAPGRIRVTDACEGCGHCTATCTSNVRVHEEVARYRAVVDPGCMKCLDCVDVCPKDALYFGFRKESQRGPRKGRRTRNFDFSWPEELLLAGTFAASLFAFRGLYDAVPFLLAIGLAVLAAAGTLALVRLLSRRDFSWQGHVLKRGGSWTGASFAGLSLVLPFLAFTLHSGAVRYSVASGESALQGAAALDRSDPGRRAGIELGIERLERAQELALVETPRVWNRLADGYYALGRIPEARASLEASLALEPENGPGLVLLADLRMRAGDQAGALEALEQLLDHEAQAGEALRRLQSLLTRDPGLEEAALLLARFLWRAGRGEEARARVASLLASNPGNEAAARLLEEWRAAAD